MPIYKALLKYGHSNFIFEIIEYCEPKMTLQREQYYLDHYDFDYNVLAKAHSLWGYKHTKETLVKMTKLTNALGYKHTLETLAQLRNSQINKKHTDESIEKMRELWAERKFKKQINKLDALFNNRDDFILKKVRKKIKGKLVNVTNIDTNVSNTYSSISEAALALDIERSTLRTNLKNKKIFNLVKRKGTIIIKEKLIITFEENP